MHSTVKRLALLGALGTTLGIVAPAAGASAAGTPVAPAKLAALQTGFPGFAPEFVPFVAGAESVNGQVIVGPAVVGPVVHTTAPSLFINVNNQDSVAGNVAGVQVAGP